jgi:hypothetical protein
MWRIGGRERARIYVASAASIANILLMSGW